MIASGAVAMVAAPTTTAAAAPNKSGTSPRWRQAADADESGAATRAAITRPLINVLVGCTSVLLSQTEAPPAHLTPYRNETPHRARSFYETFGAELATRKIGHRPGYDRPEMGV